MGTITEALAELFTRLGYTAQEAQRFTAFALFGFVGLMVGLVFLSAWDMQWLIWVIFAFYTIGALSLMFSPVLWVSLGTFLYVTGQFGGKDGLSFEDGVSEIKKWGIPTINTMGYMLLFAGSLWFLYTGTVSTTGYVGYNLGLLFVLPTLIYLVKRRWPDGKTFEAVVRSVIIAAAIGIVALTAYNTVERSVTDPAAQVVQKHLAKQKDANAKNDQLLAESIRGKLERGDVLSKNETIAWSVFKAEAGEVLTAKEQALVDQFVASGHQLRQSTPKTKAEAFVENAQPTDKGWWKAHWVPIGGIVLAIIVGYFWFGRTGATPAAATTASAPAPAGTTKKSRKGLLALIALALAGWSWYSISEEVGWPGTLVADLGYEHQVQLILPDLKDQEVCDPALRPGKWRVIFPDEAYLEHRLHKGRYLHRAGFHVLYPDGQRDRLSFQSHVLVNGVETGRDERVTITEKRCYKVTVRTTAEAREKAVVYGNPLCGNIDACVPSVTPKPGLAVLRFYK